MFPALRQNGLARWLALLLALFTLAAGLLLCLALELKTPRGRLATSIGTPAGGDVALGASRSGPQAQVTAARREPARR